MNDQKIRHWAGGFGIAGFVVFLAVLPLYLLGVGPGAPLENAAQFTDLIAGTNKFILIRTAAADPLIMVGFLVFLAGLRHLVRQACPDHEWIGTLVFGVGLVVITIELVGDGLKRAPVWTRGCRPTPLPVRALMDVSFPMFGGIG